MNFKEWFSKNPDDMYGFENNKEIPPNVDAGDKPLNVLKTEVVINELVRLGAINNKSPRKTWLNNVEWGTHGPITADVSPLGSFKVFIRRESHDLLGQKVQICKKVVPLVKEFTRNSLTKEIELAHRLHEVALEIDSREGGDSPKGYYPQIEQLTLTMADQVRKNHPNIMTFDSVKKMDSSYYITSFNYRGHGAESHRSGGVAQRCEAFHINTKFDPKTGTIRCWGHEVISPMRGHKWSVGTSQWDETFMPSQSIPEIIECVVTLFTSY